jgi:AcrR family transcriptional regulator
MNNVLDTLPLRTRKPRGQGASRRGEILDAAKRLFTEEGFAHATMRRIASEVGVSPTALYLHFSDKEAILRAIAEDFFEELLVVLQRTESCETDRLKKLRAGMRAYVEFAAERPDEYRLTFQVRHVKVMDHPNEEPDVADLSFAVLENAVEALLADGTFRPGDPVVIAESIWCALHGLTSILMDMNKHTQSTRDSLTDCVIAMILNGLSCREPAVG